MVAGAYTLTPLQGALEVFSTILYPGSTPHEVFAPTSHPLPVIEPHQDVIATKASSTLLSYLELPSTFTTSSSSSPCSVFLIRQLRTGIEGLSKGAVPGFSHIWLEEMGPWGLRGVHPVCKVSSSHLLPSPYASVASRPLVIDIC